MDILDRVFMRLFLCGMVAAFIAWLVPLGYGLSALAMIAAWAWAGGAILWVLLSRVWVLTSKAYVRIRQPA